MYRQVSFLPTFLTDTTSHSCCPRMRSTRASIRSQTPIANALCAHVYRLPSNRPKENRGTNIFIPAERRAHQAVPLPHNSLIKATLSPCTPRDPSQNNDGSARVHRLHLFRRIETRCPVGDKSGSETHQAARLCGSPGRYGVGGGGDEASGGGGGGDGGGTRPLRFPFIATCGLRGYQSDVRVGFRKTLQKGGL